eukprot:GGOE01050137.1.p1 GENE.GGOE01050137.1~~GGOE01050137.1.p1  ORF type:complete len:1156 (-),score=276.28 GGOE01050137.1:35-3502(-)
MGICHCKDPKDAPVFDPALVTTDDQRQKLCKKVAQVVTGKDEKGRDFVNEYSVIKHLGSGTYGTVNLCEHYQTQEQFAVKVIPRVKVKKANVAEAEILKKLRHTNVIQMYELMDDAAQEFIYLVLEFVADGAIMSLDGDGQAKTPPLQEPSCARCMKQVIEGLAYLHSMNIIHRDIKPDNLLIDRKKDVVKLCDFGVGMLFENENDTVRKTEGTPFFLAPEACRGQYYSGKSCDIWQLGITLFALIFGRVPFLAANQIALFSDIQQKPLSIPPGHSSNLSHLLQRMLEKDALIRISLNEIKDHPWVTGENSPVPNTMRLVATASAESLTYSEPPRPTRSPTDVVNYRMLIVEDVFLQRSICRKIMESITLEGKLTIDEAPDGGAAINLCRTHFYHLILMDIHLPGVNGFEATVNIRSIQRDRGDGLVSWIVGLTGDTHESVPSVANSSGMNEVLWKPATPASMRQLCVKYEIPLRDSASVGFKPRALLKNGPRDMKKRGHATITAYEKFLRKKGEEFAEASQCSGSEIDVKGAEWQERDADQRSVATSSRSSLMTGTVYEEHDLAPLAMMQFVEAIRAVNKRAEMQLSARFYASLHERATAVAMAVIRRQMPNQGGSRILFDERMLLAHMEADLLQVKHTLRQVLIRSSGLHAMEGALATSSGIRLPGVGRCHIYGRSSRGSEPNAYQFFTVVPFANVLVRGAPLELEADTSPTEDDARTSKVHVAAGCDDLEKARSLPRLKGEERADGGSPESSGQLVSSMKGLTTLKARTPTRAKEKPQGVWDVPGKGIEVGDFVQDDAVVGLFDGHGATDVAAYARDTMLHNLVSSGCYPADLQAALIDAFRMTDKRIREWVNLNNEPARVGTTAMVGVLRRGTLWVANAGDSQALLVRRDFTTTRLTDIHIPTNEAERHHVQKRGGTVTFREGAWRVNGELLVTRILGVPLCRRVVTCHPHVISHKVDPANDCCVLLAAGIWSVMSEADVAQFLAAAFAEVAASVADLQQGALTVEAVLRRRNSVLYLASRLMCDSRIPPFNLSQRPRVTPPGATLTLPPQCLPLPDPPASPIPEPLMQRLRSDSLHGQDFKDLKDSKDGSFGQKPPLVPVDSQSDYLLVEDHLVIAQALVLEAASRSCGENVSVVLLCFSGGATDSARVR